MRCTLLATFSHFLETLFKFSCIFKSYLNKFLTTIKLPTCTCACDQRFMLSFKHDKMSNENSGPHGDWGKFSGRPQVQEIDMLWYCRNFETYFLQQKCVYLTLLMTSVLEITENYSFSYFASLWYHSTAAF